ncbi:GyrI-like domain-containing protein [Tessaracoccus lubricantis]
MTESQPAPYYEGPPRSEVEFLEAAEIPTVVQKFKDHPLAAMPQAIDEAASALFPALEAEGLRPAGPVFVLYERMPDVNATFEVGVPVDRPLTATVPTPSGAWLEGSVLPGGAIATVSHVGSYDRLGEAWGAFLETVESAHRKAGLPFWEIYMTEPTPEADPESMRTELVIVLTD